MQQIAAYWLVLELTGSAVAVGVMALVQTLPVTALALVGGSIADRVDLRRMIVVVEAVLALQAAVLCALALTGVVAVWQLYVLGFVQGIALALDAPARHTLVFQIVGRDDLTNAVALSSSLGTTARIVGPALGGLVVASAGAGVAFGLNAVSYGVAICALLAMRLRPRPPRSKVPSGVLGGVGEALRFAIGSRRVAVTFFTVLLVSTFSFNFDVLLPLVARLTLDEGAGTFGLIASVFGCGALCGALILAAVGRARMLLVLGGALGFGGLQLVLAPQSTLAGRLRDPVRGGHLLRPLGLERAGDAPAGGAGAPARAGGEPVLLRVHGRRPARRPRRRLADSVRRDPPRVRVRGDDGAARRRSGRGRPPDGPPARSRPTVEPGGSGMTAVEQTFSTTHCAFGVARRDVTPPVGIYSRSWGAATHDVAEGVHRPLTATAGVFAPLGGDGPTLALVALDAGWFPYGPDERALREAIMERSGLGEAEVLVQLSHTHAGANTNSQIESRPGSELIAPYLESADRAGLRRGGRGARHGDGGFRHVRAGPLQPRGEPGLLGRRRGAVRVRLQPGAAQRTTRSWSRASRTRAAGRSQRSSTTPATRPRSRGRTGLLSPDYVGAAREVLEAAFEAPALFLQGASGELAPRDDYVGDPAVADRNGRQLGHAAAAAIEALPPPGTRFVYTGIVASGANLGTWEYRPCDAAQLVEACRLEAVATGVELERKKDIGVVESLSSSAPDSPQEREKAMRRELLRLALGDGPVHRMPIWAWRLGEALLLAVPNEPYSVFQTRAAAALRRNACLRPDDDERRRRLPASAGDVRLRPLPGATVAVRARLPRAGDGGGGGGARAAAAEAGALVVVREGLQLGLPRVVDLGQLDGRHGMALDRLGEDRHAPRSTSSSPIQPVGDEADAGVSRSSTRTPAVDEQRDELRRDDARAGDVDEDDVRLDRLRVEARRLAPNREPGPRAPARAGCRPRPRSQLVPGRRAPAAAAMPARWTLAPPTRCSIRRPRSTDHRLAPGEHCAHRRRDALVERERDGVGRRGEVGASGTPSATAALTSRAPSRCTRQSWRFAAAASASVSLDRQHRAARARMRVLEHEQRRPHLGDRAPRPRRGSIRPSALPERRRARARRARDPHRLRR